MNTLNHLNASAASLSGCNVIVESPTFSSHAVKRATSREREILSVIVDAGGFIVRAGGSPRVPVSRFNRPRKTGGFLTRRHSAIGCGEPWDYLTYVHRDSRDERLPVRFPKVCACMVDPASLRNHFGDRPLVRIDPQTLILRDVTADLKFHLSSTLSLRDMATRYVRVGETVRLCSIRNLAGDLSFSAPVPYEYMAERHGWVSSSALPDYSELIGWRASDAA